MHHINLIGASGTGKTTLGRLVAAELNIPFFDSDQYFHMPTDPPFQKQYSPEERSLNLETDLNKHPSWVLAGGAATWVPTPKLDPTLTIFLYLEPKLRLERLLRREQELYGDRLKPAGDMHKTHIEFMEWTRGYDDGSSEGTNTLPKHEDLIRNLKTPVLKLIGSMSLDEQMEKIRKYFVAKKTFI